MANESTLWSWLRDRALPPGHWVRLENRVGLGTPDVNGCFRGIECWMELKYHQQVKLGTRPFKKRGLSKEQIIWIEDRHEAQGLVWIVAGVGKDVMWIHPKYASTFNLMTYKDLIDAAALFMRRGDQFAQREITQFLLSA